MKKILAFSILICLLLTGCTNHRRAEKGLGHSAFLHTDGTSLVDGTGKTVQLAAAHLSVEEKTELTAPEQMLQSDVNALSLDIPGELVDDSTLPWKLKEKAAALLDSALESCERAEKYLLVDITDYPQSYNSDIEGSDYKEGVFTLWESIAERCGKSPFFGGYMLTGLPRFAESEEVSSLAYLEQFLSELAARIRSKDAEHLLLLGSIAYYNENYDEFLGLPFIKDKNFCFVPAPEAFAFFTEQEREASDGAEHLSYPNSLLYNIKGIVSEESFEGHEIDFSTMDYQTRLTDPFTVTEDGRFARLGVSVIPEGENGGGELRVWEMRFVECDKEGKEKKVLYDMKSSPGIPFMCHSVSGSVTEGSVYPDDNSAYLESMSEATFFYADNLNIPLEKGKYYRLSVTMKQRGMNKNFSCTPMVETYTCESSTAFDKSYLADYCAKLFDEADKVGVPLVFDAVGANENALKRGGAEFARDFITAIETLSQSYILR